MNRMHVSDSAALLDSASRLRGCYVCQGRDGYKASQHPPASLEWRRICWLCSKCYTQADLEANRRYELTRAVQEDHVRRLRAVWAIDRTDAKATHVAPAYGLPNGR